MKSAHLIATAMIIPMATSALAIDKSNVLETYADIAAAKYHDSLITAQSLQASVNALLDNPSAEALQAAKESWLKSRIPYQQTEVYRFGNAIVDDWEVNRAGFAEG